MIEPDVLVIGGGPAGLSAALEAARAGLTVELVEQRESLGGAIHRQPIAGVAPISLSSGARAEWKALERAFSETRVTVRYGSVFLGVDADGFVLIENRRSGRLEQVRTKSVILATGAVEKILPRLGWQTAGVSTAGGLQVMMKETGKAPTGRILLAGTGPLLIAVAAQMADLGNPPVAIVEAGDPLCRPLSGLAMAAHPALVREAAGYLSVIYRRRIPWLRGMQIEAIERDDNGLQVAMRRHDGKLHRLEVDRIGLHDGISPNDFGLPSETAGQGHTPMIVRAGDCREALGALAAGADGRRAGRVVVHHLSRSCGRPVLDRVISRARNAQSVLSALFAPVAGPTRLSSLPDETIICRCEGKTIGDLRQLCNRADRLTGREVKHNGRFAMGACQGRFCAVNTAALMAELATDGVPPKAEHLTGHRWPIRPVSIAALTGTTPANSEQEERGLPR